MDFANKTVLVTGATGLIGSNIVYDLIQRQNVKVIASVRNRSKLEKLFSEYFDRENFSYIVHDISTTPIDIQEPVDYIFHAAGPISGNIIQNNPVDVISPNLDGLKNCLEFLRRQQKGRLILFSSATIYARALESDLRVTEDDTTETIPLSSSQAMYSETKRMCELIGRAYLKQYGVDVVIARIGYVYGYTKLTPDTAFYQFIRNAIQGKDIVLRAANFTNRDNIYVKDAVSGLLHIGLHGQSGEAYNVSSNAECGNYTSIDFIAQEIVRSVNQQRGSSVSVEYLHPHVGDPLPGVILDNTKLKNLGWKIATSLSEGINEVVKLFLETERRDSHVS